MAEFFTTQQAKDLSGYDFITTDVAAGIIGLKVRRIRQLIASGKITATKFGRDWQIDRASVEAYAEAHKRKEER